MAGLTPTLSTLLPLPTPTAPLNFKPHSLRTTQLWPSSRRGPSGWGRGIRYTSHFSALITHVETLSHHQAAPPEPVEEETAAAIPPPAPPGTGGEGASTAPTADDQEPHSQKEGPPPAGGKAVLTEELDPLLARSLTEDSLPIRLPKREFGRRIYSGYGVEPAVEQVDVGVFDLINDTVKSHPSDEQHTASAEECLVFYSHGYFTACAHAALTGFTEEVERGSPHLKPKLFPIMATLSETQEHPQVGRSYLQRSKGQYSSPEDQAFAKVLRESFFDDGADAHGGQHVAILQQNFRVSRFNALNAATAKGEATDPRKKIEQTATDKKKKDETKS